MAAAKPASWVMLTWTDVTPSSSARSLALPAKRMKGCPEVFMIVSFSLSHRLESPRIALAVESYPGRWTHHMIISEMGQIDDELLDWLREAHDFALTK